MLVVNRPLETLRSFFRAIEAGESLDAFLDPSMIQKEYPSAVAPAVSERDLAGVLAGAVAGSQLLATQRYDEIEAFEMGDRAIVRLTWTATVAKDLGPFTAGQRLTAHIALFATVRGNRIVHQASYDCYEPL